MLFSPEEGKSDTQLRYVCLCFDMGGSTPFLIWQQRGSAMGYPHCTGIYRCNLSFETTFSQF